MNNENLYPELSAYVLGELSPEKTQAIEKALENDEALRSELEAVKATVLSLEEHFSAESLPELTAEQKDKISSAAQKKPLLLFPLKWMGALSAVAAILVAVLTLNPSYMPKNDTALEQIFDSQPIMDREESKKDLREIPSEEKIDALALRQNEEKVIVEKKPSREILSSSKESLHKKENRPLQSRTHGLAPSPQTLAPVTKRANEVRAKPKVSSNRKWEQVGGDQLMEADFDNSSFRDESGLVVVGTIAAPAKSSSTAARQDKQVADGFSNADVMKSDAPLAMKGRYGGRPSGEARAKIKGAQAPKPRPAVASSLSMMEDLEEEIIRANNYGPSIDNFQEIVENEIKRVSDHPLSTFSIDVDTASYSKVRSYLKNGNRPPKDAVRIEELINYFNYAYEPPTDAVPFATHIESAICPWKPEHRLVRIGLKGKVIEQADRPALNLVFLLDVSGSMNNPNKLGLVKKSMKALLNNLDERDRVSLVVYAGASGLVLPPTSCADKQAILEALDRLKAGGSTNGGAGIDLAYKTAMQNYKKEGVNRVILCTDGDFNVGRTQTGDLVRDVEIKAKEGVFLSVLGFGMGNYKDETLEQLADKGNGNYAYIDSYSEARKVLIDQMTGTLVTIAKDVKIQVEFNPNQVAGYRLIGYENRMLAKEDFNDDKKDAGEIGAGHSVTALYEIIPHGQHISDNPGVDALKYSTAKSEPNHTGSAELLTVKLRYKQPDADVSSKVEFPFIDNDQRFEQASEDFRFATSVAGFGLLLRDSQYKGSLSFENLLSWSADAQGEDEFGYRREFNELVRNAKSLAE